MKPYSVDTNLLIRMVTLDAPELAAKAKQIISALPAASIELDLYVLAEVVYVLASNKNYAFTRKQIQHSLVILIAIPQFNLDRASATQALKNFGTSKLDFVDCLLLAQNQLHSQTILTFDKSLQRALS